MSDVEIGKVARHSSTITDHARQRWHERMPATARGPRYAFRHATRADGMEMHPHFYRHPAGTPTGVHVYYGETATGERYSAVFVEIDGVVVTVYSIESVESGAVRAYLHALGKEGGVCRE